MSVGERVVIDPSLAGVPDGSKFAGKGDLFGELAVIGATEDGGYAELCLVPASHVYRVPDGMPIEHAATFPTCWLTATHGLFDVGQLLAGETVLIHAAGSGVSVAGIQLAKQAGATVLATAGTDEKCQRALDLGADFALNNRTGDVVAWAREVTQGGGVTSCSITSERRCSARRCSPSALEGGWWRAATRRAIRRPSRRSATCSTRHLDHRFGSVPPRRVRPGVANVLRGDFRSMVDSEFALADAGAAQDKLARNDVFGKIILRP